MIIKFFSMVMLSSLLAMLLLGRVGRVVPSAPATQDAPIAVTASTNTKSCPIIPSVDERVYDALANSDIHIQPWLLTEGSPETMQKTWQSFYNQLRPEVKAAVQPAKVLKVNKSYLIKGEAFADRLQSDLLKKYFDAKSPGTIPVVYTDFDFSLPLHKDATGIYFRQKYPYLSVTEKTDSYSASSETQFLTWLAYVNL